MKVFRRVASLVFFLFAIYFVARSDVLVNPEDITSRIPIWVKNAPVPIACFPDQSSPCPSQAGAWPVKDHQWAVPLITDQKMIYIYYTSIHSCTKTSMVDLPFGGSIGLYHCPELPASWSFDSFSTVNKWDQIEYQPGWTIPILQQNQWEWTPASPVTWLSSNGTMFPFFEFPVEPLPGTPIVQPEKKQILGVLIKSPEMNAWFTIPVQPFNFSPHRRVFIVGYQKSESVSAF